MLRANSMVVILVALSIFCFVAFPQKVIGTKGDAPWSTAGNKIIDNNGDQIYFSGVNWNGFEGMYCVADGLSAFSLANHILQLKQQKFNLIRLAFAGTCVTSTTTALSIDYSANPKLQGLTTLQVMEAVIDAAAVHGIKVILDYHRLDRADRSGTSEAGLWFTDNIPVEKFKDTWTLVAKAFVNKTNVVGVEIFNEPHNSLLKPPAFPGPNWDLNTTDPYNFKNIVDEVAANILAIQPNWLICVQGMWNESWWGGNLKFAYKHRPNIPKNKLVYTIHDYGPVVKANQSWFSESSSPAFPDSLIPHWDSTWGFMHTLNIAPVWVGEFGSRCESNSSNPLDEMDRVWLRNFVDYIRNNSLVWTWFTWGPYSAATGGVYLPGWAGIDYNKLSNISSILYEDYSLPTAPPPVEAPPPPIPSPPRAPRIPPLALFLSSPPPSAPSSTPPTGGAISSLTAFMALLRQLFISALMLLVLTAYGHH